MMYSVEFIPNAEKAVDHFNKEIEAIFPDYMVKAFLRNNLGPHVVIEFFNVASKDDAVNKILLNTDHMKFMMHLCDNRGRLSPKDKFSIEMLNWAYTYRNAGIKFRKINGKSPMDAMEKLLKWFKKNRDAVIAVKK